jgi:hypothetical protein
VSPDDIGRAWLTYDKGLIATLEAKFPARDQLHLVTPRKVFDPVEYQRQYRKANKAKIAEQRRAKHVERRKDSQWVASERKRGRDYWGSLRHEATMAYGGYSCACCGETEPKFLSIDHVFNNGAAHRREIAVWAKGNGEGASSRTLKWLKDNGYPAGFQVLCMNCNLGKQRNGGMCPHKIVRALSLVMAG